MLCLNPEATSLLGAGDAPGSQALLFAQELREILLSDEFLTVLAGMCSNLLP